MKEKKELKVNKAKAKNHMGQIIISLLLSFILLFIISFFGNFYYKDHRTKWNGKYGSVVEKKLVLKSIFLKDAYSGTKEIITKHPYSEEKHFIENEKINFNYLYKIYYFILPLIFFKLWHVFLALALVLFLIHKLSTYLKNNYSVKFE